MLILIMMWMGVAIVSVVCVAMFLWYCNYDTVKTHKQLLESYERLHAGAVESEAILETLRTQLYGDKGRRNARAKELLFEFRATGDLNLKHTLRLMGGWTDDETSPPARWFE